MGLLLRLGGGFLNRLLAVVMAVMAAQVPVYYGQYLQTLGGVRLEAEARYLELRREAAAVQLEVEDFVLRHERSPDRVFQASGRIHRSTLQRYQRFDASYRALSTADIWHKPLLLARQFDPAIHAAVRFTPGLPLHPEGLGWALCGVLLAGLCSSLLGFLLVPNRRAIAGRL